MKNSNDELIRKALKSEPLPEQLSPDNMKKMLDEKAPAKKRKKITHTAARITAGAAACAIICGFGVHYTEQRDQLYTDKATSILAEDSETAVEKVEIQPSYMSGASKYDEIYSMLKVSAKNYSYTVQDYETGITGGFGTDDMLIMDGAAPENEIIFEENAMEPTNAPAQNINGTVTQGGNKGDEDHYETYNQEEGVLEGDIARTDGRYIYYIPSAIYDEGNLYLNVAEAENGSFISGGRTDISADLGIDYSDSTYIQYENLNMFLYNDMVIITGSVCTYSDMETEVSFCGLDSDICSFVTAYTAGSEPELIGSYFQDGGFIDVRISPDGYLYLITNYTSEEYANIDGAEDYKSYIPCRSWDGCAVLIEPEDILLPGEYTESSCFMNYTVIGGLDLNTSGELTEVGSKALAGYTGEVYCSESNLYTVCGYTYSEITRIALDAGTVTPAASGKVQGYIKDQFSMSEYNGYFRIATTAEVWEDAYSDAGDESSAVVSHTLSHIENRVYVLDLDMNIVGQIGGLGIGETIKSVSFSGDIGYVVTYEQTDPLFSIDLSNPAEPVLMDEYKILGYSTYMQQWSDGLLLGFGANADENGREDGVKLVMFDNSDPYNLDEKGIFIMDSNYFHTGYYDSWIYSEAMNERKALMIAPEKNLIGVPVWCENYDGSTKTMGHYIFFSYEDGEFVQKGEIAAQGGNIKTGGMLNRALYIGDYVYVLSEDRFISADIETITECDTIEF